MDKEFEEFIKFRCITALLKAGIDPEKIDIDACVRSYKSGFKDALRCFENNNDTMIR